MAKPLQSILEQEFNLAYYLHLSIKDIEDMDLKEIEWLYGRLVKQKKDEFRMRYKEVTGKDYIEDVNG